MKYYQFVEFKKLLEENKVTFQEWLENPELNLNKTEPLNEILGIKSLISWGIMKPMHLSKIKSVAQDFMKEAMKGLQDAIEPYTKAKQKLLPEIETIEWKELTKENKIQVNTIEKKIENVLTTYVSKVRQMKTDAVYKRIEKATGLTDAAKLSLKYTWETLATKVETSLLSHLLEKKVIMSPKLREKTKLYQSELKKDLQAKGEKIKSEIKPEDDVEEPTKKKDNGTIRKTGLE